MKVYEILRASVVRSSSRRLRQTPPSNHLRARLIRVSSSSAREKMLSRILAIPGKVLLPCLAYLQTPKDV